MHYSYEPGQFTEQPQKLRPAQHSMPSRSSANESNAFNVVIYRRQWAVNLPAARTTEQNNAAIEINMG